MSSASLRPSLQLRRYGHRFLVTNAPPRRIRCPKDGTRNLILFLYRVKPAPKVWSSSLTERSVLLSDKANHRRKAFRYMFQRGKLLPHLTKKLLSSSDLKSNAYLRGCST